MTAQFTIDSLDAWQASAMARPPQQALFLHTGWRSGGSWIWSSLREDASVMAFYEPLNEQLATLNGARIARLRPGSWHSGHTGSEPYYSEFRDLILRRGRGVQGYQERFAADRFFMGEEERDPALAAYLALLLRRAQDQGRVPVLKFCRSLGRVGWMQREFPEALHAVVLRDPLGQWRSAREQVERSGNGYFLAGPLLILARNAAHPLVAEALDRFGVHLPTLSANGSLALDQEICWRHIARLPWAERYRGFLACWTASAIASLTGCPEQPEAMVVDSDALLTSRGHREEVETTILARLGLPLSLAPRAQQSGPPRDQQAEPVDQDAIARAHACAIGMLQARGAALPDAAYARIMEKLAPPLEAARPSRLGSVQQALRPRLQGTTPRSWRQAAYVASIRLSMTWRRLRRRTRRLLDA